MIPDRFLNLSEVLQHRTRVRTPTETTSDTQRRSGRTRRQKRTELAFPAHMKPGPQGGTPRTRRGEGLPIPSMEPRRTHRAPDRNRATRRARLRQSPDRRPLDLPKIRRLDMTDRRDLMTRRLKKLVSTVEPPTFPDEMTHALEMNLVRVQSRHLDGRIIHMTPLPRTHLREPPGLEPLAQLSHETT